MAPKSPLRASAPVFEMPIKGLQRTTVAVIIPPFPVVSRERRNSTLNANAKEFFPSTLIYKLTDLFFQSIETTPYTSIIPIDITKLASLPIDDVNHRINLPVDIQHPSFTLQTLRPTGYHLSFSVTKPECGPITYGFIINSLLEFVQKTGENIYANVKPKTTNNDHEGGRVMTSNLLLPQFPDQERLVMSCAVKQMFGKHTMFDGLDWKGGEEYVVKLRPRSESMEAIAGNESWESRTRHMHQEAFWRGKFKAVMAQIDWIWKGLGVREERS